MKLAAAIITGWTALGVIVALPLGRLLRRRSDEMRKVHEERGAVAVMVAILAPVVLLGMLALVVDLGSVVTARRVAVQGADAAALAAAQACGLPSTAADAEGAADKLAAENVADFGALSDLEGGIVEVHGCGSAVGAVRVRYVATIGYSFAGVFGVHDGQVGAEATAAWSTSVEGGGDPVVGNPSPTGSHTKDDPNADNGRDCSNPSAGGPTPGGNVDHCTTPVVAVRLIG